MRSPRVRVRRSRMPRRPLSGFSVNRMVPNVLTLLALCAGMTAIRFAITGKYQAAVAAIMIAGVLDGLDGRIARLLKSTSRFGAELDSLSDFVSFGVAPATVLYLWTMAALHGIGWAIVLFFAVCCALRLARFNTQLGVEVPPHAGLYFSGVPAPAGAMLAIVPMFAAFEWGDWLPRSPYLVGAWVAGVALLMVSTIPTVSLKRFRLPPHLVMPTLLGIGLIAAFLSTAPWLTLIVIGLAYLGSIPLTMRAAQRRRAAVPARRAETGEPPVLAPPRPPPPPPYPLGDSTAPDSDTRH
ncbi:MAG TPA: CDP-diacylglycerol--serine O-phosphatidyltransferase [Stellaceae bacterium]|nr:CDP-diacylglycerol--serine O-phosphatidyltransferase [Stellaceae bacterium]